MMAIHLAPTHAHQNERAIEFATIAAVHYTPSMATSSTTQPISLALQGGGSHGAFTWGVLDRLLEDGRPDIQAITGASAGAMNAVALADGYVRGGREGARASLQQFWTAVGEKASELFAADLPGTSFGAIPSSLTTYLDLAEHMAPELLDPFDLNPMRGIVERCFDFDRLRASAAQEIFVSATNVRTGKIRVFRNADLSPDVLLASACLPAIHRTIEIDGEAYWDGGFSGNPPVFPLIFNECPADILLVLLQPLIRTELPRGAQAIRERAGELGFHVAFLREMRAIAISKDYIGFLPGSGRLEQRLHALRLHLLAADSCLPDLPPRSRLNAMPDFLNRLFAAGRAAAGIWLLSSYGDVGVRSSFDVSARFA